MCQLDGICLNHCVDGKLDIKKYLYSIKCFQEHGAPSTKLELTKELEAQNKLQTFFRGQKSIDFSWEPSVFRDNLLDYESSIYHECIKQFPMEFSGLKTVFDRLAKIQHYGGATRIMDFTVDPLVALWFACNREGEWANTDGKVAMYRTVYSDEYELGVRCLSFLATYSEEIDNHFFDKLREHLQENHSDDVLREAMKQHYFVIPQITNERIRRQKGLFMIFGQACDQDEKEKRASCLDEKFGRGEEYPGYIGHITIPSEAKARILSELENEKITKDYLMPDIETEFKKIIEGCKQGANLR